MSMRKKKVKIKKTQIKKQSHSLGKFGFDKEKYVPIKAVFGAGEDYYVYSMNSVERIKGGLLGFLGGFLVSMIFFRAYLFSLIVGCCMIVPGIMRYKSFLRDKRTKDLQLQFRDMMESLAGSFSAGKNTENAFRDAYVDMSNIYGAQSYIVHEIELIVSGMYNGINLDILLQNFADRSHLDDIESFSAVFEISNKYGGNLKKVVWDTHKIISEKIEIEMEIQTILSGNKNELRMMLLMPLIIMLSLSSMGNMSVIENTPANVLVKLIAFALFGAAYFMGSKIVNIEV